MSPLKKGVGVGRGVMGWDGTRSDYSSALNFESDLWKFGVLKTMFYSVPSRSVKRGGRNPKEGKGVRGVGMRWDRTRSNCPSPGTLSLDFRYSAS